MVFGFYILWVVIGVDDVDGVIGDCCDYGLMIVFVL